jgi:hypothetical protein
MSKRKTRRRFPSPIRRTDRPASPQPDLVRYAHEQQVADGPALWAMSRGERRSRRRHGLESARQQRRQMHAVPLVERAS